MAAGGSNPAAPVDLFLSIGLDRRTAENAVANPNLTANLSAVIREAGVADGCGKAAGNLLFSVATKYPAHALTHRPRLLEYIVSAKIKYTSQLDAALLFLGKIGPGSLDVSRFEEECGVGVDVSLEKTQSSVVAVLEENMDAIMEQRYHINGLEFILRALEYVGCYHYIVSYHKKYDIVSYHSLNGSLQLMKQDKNSPTRLFLPSKTCFYLAESFYNHAVF